MEQLIPTLARELQILMKDHPARVTSPKLNVFSKFSVAFDMLEAVLGPASNIYVFNVIGLASVINCVTSETEPYSWGAVVIPLSLLRGGS